MKIRRIKLQGFEQFPSGEFFFRERVTFIRGENGAGKTILLEAAALLGHTPILDRSEPIDFAVNAVEMLLYLSRKDAIFLRSIFGDDLTRKSADAVCVRVARDALSDEFAIGAQFWTDEALERVRAWLVAQKGDLTKAKISVAFRPTRLEVDDPDGLPELKLSLADDAKVRKDWMCVAPQEIYDLVGLLMSWSRPERVEGASEKRWRLTPRSIARRSQSDPESAPHAGVVSYINTDMYDYGIGLDLRESPKHLQTALTPVVVERLQLFDRAPGEAPFDVRGHDRLQESWSRVFSDSRQRLNQFKFNQYDYGPPADGSWFIHLGYGETTRRFLSSGENQLLFLFSMISALEPYGSILLMDEPELHLSFLASRNLVEEMLYLADDMDVQIIVATHTPFLFRDSITSHLETMSDSFDATSDGSQEAMSGALVGGAGSKREPLSEVFKNGIRTVRAWFRLRVVRWWQRRFKSRLPARLTGRSKRARGDAGLLLIGGVKPIYHGPAFDVLSKRYQSDLDALMHSMELPDKDLGIYANTKRRLWMIALAYVVACAVLVVIPIARDILSQ